MVKSLVRSLSVSTVFVVIVFSCASPSQQSENDRSTSAAPYHGTDVEFEARAGNEVSYFIRKKAPGTNDDRVMASQLRVRSGSEPGITTSWPAGNSGIYFSLASSRGTTDLVVKKRPVPVSKAGGQRGIDAVISASVGVPETDSATGAPHSSSAGTGQDFVLTPITEASMRDIRDVRDYKTPHPEFSAPIRREGGELVAERESIDHLTHYHLALHPVDGTRAIQDGGGHWHLISQSGKPVEFKLEATTDEAPLTPVPIERIVTPEVLQRSSPRQLQELSYLVYDQEILAGADNYLTMFGRDNEFLLTIGAEGLRPKAYEIVFASHLEAMREDGNLAHEPAIGEFGSVLNEKAGKGPVRIPVYDYKMMDTRFLLAPSVVKYLHKVSPERAQAFFARKTSKGLTYKEALIRNLNLVVSNARAFAKKHSWRNLISLLPGQPAGQWRDSDKGLGGGRYPFDINVALMPAALHAVSEIDRALPDPRLDRLAASARSLYKSWSEDSWKFFEVSLKKERAIRDIRRYGRQLGLGEGLVQSALSQPVRKIAALSLDANGKPIPILNTDGGFLLLYSDDVPDERIRILLREMSAAFPSGLYSPAGLFISNAAHAPSRVRKNWNFTPYHGVVIWPWQEFLWAEGLKHQLTRHDLQPETVAALKKAELKLWRLLYRTSAYLSLELYSARPQGDTLVPAPWSPKNGNASAMIQAWSELGLLIHPPARVTRQLGEMPGFGISTPSFAQ